MRLALAHLVQNPNLASKADDLETLDAAGLPGIEIYRELIDFCRKRPNMSTAQLMELWRDNPAQPHLRTLATWQLPGDDEQQAQEFHDAVTRLQLQWIESQIAGMPRIVELSQSDRAKLLQYQQRRQELIRALQGGDS